MKTIERIRCDWVAPGIEVVTSRADHGFEAEIHGGPLDGQTFSDGDADALHDKACRLARMAGWGQRGTGWRS